MKPLPILLLLVCAGCEVKVHVQQAPITNSTILYPQSSKTNSVTINGDTGDKTNKPSWWMDNSVNGYSYQHDYLDIRYPTNYDYRKPLSNIDDFIIYSSQEPIITKTTNEFQPWTVTFKPKEDTNQVWRDECWITVVTNPPVDSLIMSNVLNFKRIK